MLCAAVLVASLMAGCGPLGTQVDNSATPEVFISNVTKKQVLDRIVSAKLSKGMQIKSSDDYGVVVAKKDESLAGALLYGSQYDGTPEMRVRYSVIEQDSGVKVFSRAEMVTNPGSGYERTNDATAQYFDQMQSELEDLQQKMAK